MQKRLVGPRSKPLSAKVLRGKRGRAGKMEPRARKQAILDAALDVFAERGFEAARLDDVAARAGVAKGTLYLYFEDKEALFEEVVRGAVSPILERLDLLATAPDLPTDKILENLFAVFEKEVLGTKRKLLLRLIIAEGPRFPRIARILLSQCHLAHHAADRQGSGARCCAWRGLLRRFCALSAAGRRPAVDCGHLGRLVCEDQAARCRELSPRPSSGNNWQRAGGKVSGRKVLAAIAVLALIGAGLAAFIHFRSARMPVQFQGWVEADIVYVAPDEIGRVTTLSVREGSTVEVGSPLFTLDDDLQRAAVAENEATVINAKQAYDRADVLLTKAVGSQKDFDNAAALLRSAEARLNSSKTKLERRRMLSPVAGMIQEVYFRVGEMVEPGRPIVSIVPPGNVKVRFFVPQANLPSIHIGDRVLIHCDGCRDDLFAHVRFHLGPGRVHATCDLQPGGAGAARIPNRGDPRASRRHSHRTAGDRRPAKFIDARDNSCPEVRTERARTRPIDSLPATHGLATVRTVSMPSM